MKILIAPDKFKGSLSAQEVCDAVENGIKKFDTSIETIKHPLADGGEGTLEILQNYFELKRRTVKVKNPLFNTIVSSYMVSKEIAYIEMSNASGLQLLEKHEQNCCYTSTFGTGELIADAIKEGFKNIVLFIGGSATNDAGIGMASALGFEFFNSKNELIKPIGLELINIQKISTKNLLFNLKEINFTVVCDVKNPLYGENGAAHIYGQQKGASEKEIELLDLGLKNFSNKVNEYFSVDTSIIDGGGAAGGLGAGSVVFLNATIQSGIDFVFEQTNFNSLLSSKIDLIITGEGSVDKQTLEGKVVKGISIKAHNSNIPFYIIAGVVKDKEVINKGLDPLEIISIMDLNISVEDAMNNAAKHVKVITFNLLKRLKNILTLQ